jgi:drug/metabolite transporter (DMT)-like permease
MEVAHVAAALLSALLHAGWNAAVKASARPTEAMAAQMLMSAALVVPGKSNGAIAAPTAVAAVVSYLLILRVWTQAPIAPASALRDTSAVFAILIAIVWLKEPFTPSRMLAVLLAAAAVPLLRLT